MSKRLLFVSPTGTLDNGAEKSIVELMRYLAQNGYQVHNLYPENTHETKEAYVTTLQATGVQCQALPVAKWWWPEAPGAVPFLPSEQLVAYQQDVQLIRQYIQEHGIEVVLSNTANVFLGSIAAACEQIPHMWLLHEFPEGEFAYYREKIPFIEENSDKIFAVQGNLNQTVQELVSKQIKVHSFVPFSPVQETSLQPGTQRRIISIGQLNANKNQLELIKAYQTLGDFSIPLVFIGSWEKEYKEICDAYIAQHGLTTVEFLGFHANPWELVTEKDICVLTSQFETFSLVFVEAALNGVPTIVSDNLGYQSARDYLGIGEIYPLGNSSRLAEQVESHLTHFESYKVQSLKKKELLKEVYQPGQCYQAILEELQQLQSAAPKTLTAIQSVLGSVDFSEIHSKVTGQFVTIYVDEGAGFNEESALHFPLQKKARLSFRLPETCRRFRLDMSERSSYYAELTVAVAETKTQMLPVATNGIVQGEAYFFLENDPWVLYELPQYALGQELVLTYQLYEVDSPDDTDYIAKQLALDVQAKDQQLAVLTSALFDKTQEIQHLQQRLQEKERYIEGLQHQHITVIGSRRWTIPTKIIDFFRRKP